MNFSEKLLAKPGKKVDLNQFDPDACYGWNEPEEIKDRTAKNIRKLLDLQYKLYAEGRQSLLIVLQAMDAGGKDGVINNVIAPLNPQGCRCNSFKVPSNLEASHDFLWREHLVAPRKGEVVVFNRSHYEGVLVERVHGELSSKQLRNRFDLINDFEHLLYSNRT
ncbi:MAG: polyphosphate kinase 2 family protein, partial [Victivallaceae bacterium]